jgi:hypothetical protein
MQQDTSAATTLLQNDKQEPNQEKLTFVLSQLGLDFLDPQQPDMAEIKTTEAAASTKTADAAPVVDSFFSTLFP